MRGIRFLSALGFLVFVAGCGGPAIEGLHSLSSANYPDHFVRHRGGEGWITPIVSELDRNDATFNIVPGLADSSCYSFESINYPGMYLRHSSSRIFLHRIENGDTLGMADATFRVVPGLSDATMYSFESLNYPNHFIRHTAYRLVISPAETNELYLKDVTFMIGKPKKEL